MRIVQLITGSVAFGGAEAHVRDLAMGLRDRGHDCIVMLGPPEGLFSEQLQESGVPVVFIPSLKKPIRPISDLASLIQIVSALRKIKPDIVAVHTAKAGFVGRLAARLTGIPSVFTPHGLSFVSRKTGSFVKPLLLIEQIASQFGDRMIAVCEMERRLAIKHLNVKASKIAMIHHGLPDLQQERKHSHSRVCITMTARFDRPKDHATLFLALASLTHLDWELRLAGTGSLLEESKLFVERSGLSSRVHFLHQCSNIPALLGETDIFTLITNSEAFPISILEAMRSGLPVVATDIGGVSEAVQDGLSGFLVPRSSPFELANKLALLISSSELRHRMGSYSRVRFTEHFRWRSMLDKTEAFYAESMPERGRSRMESVTSA